MKTIQKDTYGSTKKKKTGYSVEQKTAPVQKNNVVQKVATTMQPNVERKTMPVNDVWKKRTPAQEEINNRTVRPADRGRVETDPTQGWGSKLNKDIIYNGLPNKQILQKNGEYVDLKKPQGKVMDSRFPNGVNAPPNKKEFTDSYRRAMDARTTKGKNPLPDEEIIFRSKPRFKKKK